MCASPVAGQVGINCAAIAGFIADLMEPDLLTSVSVSLQKEPGPWV